MAVHGSMRGPLRGHEQAPLLEMMSAIAGAEISRWPRGQPTRLHPKMQQLTLEIILRVVFGLAEGARLDQLRDELVRSTMKSTARVGQILLLLGPRRMSARLIRNHFRTVDRLLYAEIRERRQRDDLDERSDALSMLLQARHADGRPMSDVEIRDELITLLTAGHETTATALAWAVERLARDPVRQARLTDEIRSGEISFVDASARPSPSRRCAWSSARCSPPPQCGPWITAPRRWAAAGSPTCPRAEPPWFWDRPAFGRVFAACGKAKGIRCPRSRSPATPRRANCRAL